jgi:PAS domain-containing protein
MSEQNSTLGSRTLLAGKIISNFGQSSIDCTVRRISDRGATIAIESPLGIPKQFYLLIPGEGAPRPCKLVWQSDRELGLEFESAEVAKDVPAVHAERRGDSTLRNQMLALRAALDEIRTGVILLDNDLHAQFTNRAFRKMWDLPDAMADSKPAFVAIIYHGRETHAYQVADADFDAYVAERIRLVRAGDPTPLILRRSNGEILHMQCTVLPDGGRMLNYTDVTEIIRHADELEGLRNALDNISEGVLLLDADLKAEFLNRKVRDYWGVTKEQVAARPSYLELIANAPHAHAHGIQGVGA